MEVCRLGRTGLKVSRIGFGGMSIQDVYNVTKKQAIAAVNKTLDLGVNFIDTARVYPGSEEKIGAVMKNRRDECYLSSRSPEMGYKGMREWSAIIIRDLAISVDFPGETEQLVKN